MKVKLNFTIAEDPGQLRTDKIVDLCDYLTTKVLEPMFARDGARWNRQFMDFFTFDSACDPMEPTGRIKLAVPPLFAGRVGELENAILRELHAVGIKTSPFTHERHPTFPTLQTITIPITDNPTVLITPPEVNIAYTRGAIVLRDLLGYQQVNGRYEFAAADLLQRVSSVTEDKLAACTASPLKGPEGVRRTPSAIGMKSLRRCLDEIKQFALWAARHNYQTLAAA